MRLFGMIVPKPLEGATAACRPHFRAAAGFSALINILYLAPTIYMMQVYDRVVPTSGVLTLISLTFIVAIAIGTLSSLDAMRLRMMVRASLRLDRLLSGEILNQLMSRHRLAPGEPSTAHAMREFDTLRQALGGSAAIALFDVPWTPLYLIVAFAIHPILGVLVVGGGAILVGLAIVNERATKIGAQAASRSAATAYATQEATTANAEVVRALGMRRALVERQLGDRTNWLLAATGAQFVGGRYNSLVKFVRMFSQSLALGVGAWLAIRGQISVGAIIAASVLLSRALQPVEQLVGAWPTILSARQAIDTISRLLEANGRASAQPPIILPEPRGEIDLHRIIVRNAAGTALLLKGVSTRVSPGEILGVVGPSGAGKSTLARIISGALAPDAGEVRIDEANYLEWDPEELARYIGYLPQNSVVFAASVGENISRFTTGRAGDAEVDRAIIEAAQRAGVHELILHLPEGYATQIGENDHQLSAGQAQRIALARALYGDPKVLVLDEPNSALDAEGEEALMAAIAGAKARQCAIVIVAHRLSILSGADRMLLLNDGGVESQGSTSDVLSEIKRRAESSNIVNMRGR